MSSLSIDIEWIDPLAAKGPELRETWARLSITADSRPLTRVFDQRSRTVREAIYVPLYPLAEWIAEQWWPLWNEPPSASAFNRAGYNARHCLVSAREGYAFPPLRIEPAGSLVHLTWFSERLAHHQIEFPDHGEVWLKTDTVRESIRSMIDTVVSRLADCGITDSPLQLEWAAIQTASDDELLFCECAGALGLDPYSLDEDQQSEIVSVGQLLPEEFATEFFRAARPGSGELRADADEVWSAIERIQSNTSEQLGLTRLRERVRGQVAEWKAMSKATPWDQGYSLARNLRTFLGIEGVLLNTMDIVGEVVGASGGQFGAILGEFSKRSMPFVGLVGINAMHSPAFVLRPGYPHTRSFYFSRALCEYLFSSMNVGALVTDANTEQQKRNRAFAAEWLAPAEELRRRIASPVVTGEQVEELAREFGVSPFVVAHQVENHGIADIR